MQLQGFSIIAENGRIIRFNLYAHDAFHTVNAFRKKLPFKRLLYHARVSGQEIWTDEGLDLDIIQENASVFTVPGEMVLGPVRPERAKTSNCLGIYYGEGRGLDCCNIFAKVFEEDMPLLKSLGEEIWKYGEQLLLFEEWI